MKILFVEDDAMNRRVVSDMLGVAGLNMAEAQDAEAGLSMVEQELYDIILMDLRMPGMDGLTAIRRIRSLPNDKGQTPIIVVTADTALNLGEACASAGADDLILKPVAMDALFDSIAKVMTSRGRSLTLL